MKKSLKITSVLLANILTAGYAWAQEDQAMGTDFAVTRENVPQKEPVYSPYVGQSHPDRVYWGDSHLHTSYSWDAGLIGNTLDPDDAYRFAKGEQVEGHDGVPVRMSRPLDFIVIADHAEYMGVVQGVSVADKDLTATEDGARWSKMASEGGILEVFGEMVK